jgi:hypothetical protein
MTGAKYGSTLAEQWRSYETTLPKSAGSVQRQETRRAFYGGAQAAFEVLVHGVSAGSEVTEDDESLMVSLAAELEQFVEDVKAGRA